MEYREPTLEDVGTFIEVRQCLTNGGAGYNSKRSWKKRLYAGRSRTKAPNGEVRHFYTCFNAPLMGDKLNNWKEARVKK